MGWHDHGAASRQLAQFYVHLARCIYVEVAQMCPADFAEVRGMVDRLRVSHYLDGPNDVDWIFRNQLIARREESMYVDYVHNEDGDVWISPALYDKAYFGYSTPVEDLVVALYRLGCTTRSGLAIIGEAWMGKSLDNHTHWQEIAQVNRHIVSQLVDNGILLPEATPIDAALVINQWAFPLGGLDLREKDVPISELEAKRQHRLLMEWELG
jgi:hypothetical protein